MHRKYRRARAGFGIHIPVLCASVESTKRSTMRDIVVVDRNDQQRSRHRNFNGHQEAEQPSNSAAPSYASYREYLNSYGNKSYKSVAPPVEKKNVKSEIFIQIKDETDFKVDKVANFVIKVKPETLRTEIVRSGICKLENGNSEMKPEIMKKPNIPTPPPAPTNFYTPPKLIASKPNPPLPPNCPPPMPPNYCSRRYKPLTPPKSPDLIKAQPDKMTIAKNSVINEIKSIVENKSCNQQSKKTPYVPQNSYQITRNFLERERENKSPMNNSTIPRGWKPSPQKTGKLANVEADIVTKVPVSSPENANINKNDPNVSKMVYDTYRGFLKAYNKDANHMVSTLPRNMVVQDKGVSEQLNNIASQGCLSQLNGRTNPNPKDEM